MSGIKELKKHYLFTEADEKNLKEIAEIILPFSDEFTSHFYNHLMRFPESAKFFRAPQASERRKKNHEEEIKQKFLTARMDSVLVAFADRFTYGLNIILVLALIGLSLGIIGLFGTEIFSLLSGETEFGKTLLSAVGTLLIVWVMIELMRAEINYLKGESFHIEIFVSVALVASIRELLIATLAETSTIKLAMILASILVLGLVYFLILRTGTR